MADDVRVEFHRDYVDWLRTAPDSPVGDALERAANVLRDTAKDLAPVSATGSRHAPPGFTKDRIVTSAQTHSDDGSLARFVGSRTNRHGGAYPYPLSFVANDEGSTWNRGRRSKRPAVDYFLARAVEVAPFQTYYE